MQGSSKLVQAAKESGRKINLRACVLQASGAGQYLVGTPELFLELPEGPLHGTSVVIRAFCPRRLSAQLRPDQHPQHIPVGGPPRSGPSVFRAQRTNVQRVECRFL